jgi:hypothetical protein
MRTVQCECGVQLQLTTEILATAATEVAQFSCGPCGRIQEASYVKGRSTGARLWHATIESSRAIETPFFVEGAAQ